MTMDRMNLPSECPVTVKHAFVHLDNARDALGHDDFEQAIHDVDIALRIIMVKRDRTRKLNK